MKTVKRKANVGERIKIIKLISPTGLYVNGDVFTVRSSGNIGVRVEGILPIIFHMEYEVIEMNTIEIPHTTYVELAKSIDNNVHDELQKAYEEGYRQGKQELEMTGPPTFDEMMELGRKVLDMETPQQKRDRIVEQAKQDVEELRKRMKSTKNNVEGNKTFRGNRTEVSFVVDKEKRTIVALVKINTTSVIVERGIAKCAPGDCFNVHIGKAIALRRALGLDIPFDYLTVPNPSEVRVGDKIKWTKNYVIIGINDGTYRFRGERDGWVSSYLDYDRETLVSKIIDDSREEGSE